MRWYILVTAISAAASFLITWLTLRVALRFKLYPEIRDRDVHSRPTPRLGGVAMFIGIVVAFAVASRISYFDIVFDDLGPIYAILGAALLIVVVGILDDLLDLDWMIKLAAQMGAGIILAWQGVQILSLPFGNRVIGSPLLGLVITVFAVVLTMNAVNFIDGLDGLVAGVAIIANGVFFLYTYVLALSTQRDGVFSLGSLISAALVGVCLGFIPWNWRPAKIFMGDSGALLVGLLMATSALAVTGQVDSAALGNSQLLPAFIPILLPFAILVLPFLDFSLAVFRRLAAGKSPFSADRKHLHHRLLDMGHGHVRSVLVFYAWTATISISCLLFFVLRPYAWAFLFLGLGVIACIILTAWPRIRPGHPAPVDPALDTALIDTIPAPTETAPTAAAPTAAADHRTEESR